ncbi:unnamed protein product [Rhizoctonia solani]|uniref:Uncharacterized protein n=1 Tax=Rhizoctonia solani TaxID=456999 RepID=A0A8H3E9W1_9AGAM|nr:unnamed protein product [Rhizoctonia solani]
MPPVKQKKQLKTKGAKRHPYKHSRAKDEQVREGMKDTLYLYQITRKIPKSSVGRKVVSVEDVANGIRAL